jgi:hypothetical protein
MHYYFQGTMNSISSRAKDVWSENKVADSGVGGSKKFASSGENYLDFPSGHIFCLRRQGQSGQLGNPRNV